MVLPPALVSLILQSFVLTLLLITSLLVEALIFNLVELLITAINFVEVLAGLVEYLFPFVVFLFNHEFGEVLVCRLTHGIDLLPGELPREHVEERLGAMVLLNEF